MTSPPSTVLRRRLSLRLVACGLALFVLAAVSRSPIAPTMVTADEDTWIGMAGNFARNLQQGRFAQTYELGHPGITSLWLDLVGIGPERLARLAGLIQFDEYIPTRRAMTSHPDFLAILSAARAAHLVANAALVVLVSFLARRLFGSPAGLATGLLLALDPFLVAHGQLARMDSLQALLLATALLAAASRWLGVAAWPYLALAGLAYGLALLSKTSSVVALPVFGAMALSGGLLRGESPVKLLRWLPREAVIFGLLGIGIFVLLWPAMWVAPFETAVKMAAFTAWNSGTPPLAGNFFLGRVIADPGPLFYPVALAFRLAPLTVLGLVLLAPWAVGAFGAGQRTARAGAAEAGLQGPARVPAAPLGQPQALPCRQPLRSASGGARLGSAGSAAQRRITLGLSGQNFAVVCTVTLLLVTTLLYLVTLSSVPKKFDRYALPVIPLLLILAGVGLGWAWKSGGWVRTATLVLAGLGLAHQAASLPPLTAYPLAYYSPLAGGPSAAERTILVGWGEGMDLAAAWLNGRADAVDETVATFHEETFDASYRGLAVPLSRFAEADALVLPIDAAQRSLAPAEVAAWLADRPPDHVVRLAGLDYVRTWLLPRPVFGGQVRLEGYLLEGPTQPQGNRLTVSLDWRLLDTAAGSVVPFVQLFDEQGQPASPPVAVQPTEPVQAGRRGAQARLESPRRRGLYYLAVSLRDADGQPLAITEAPPWSKPAGSWLHLTAVTVRYR